MDSQERFWDKVDRRGSDDCWGWMGWHDAYGYGELSVGTRANRKRLKAHRVSYELAHGPIPAGLLACHHCDNPGCVNPAHLFLGTHADNTADMISKGRWVPPVSPDPVGEANSQAKLTEADVLAIRRDTRTHTAIAADYGVTRSNIGRIKRRESWRHVA